MSLSKTTSSIFIDLESTVATRHSELPTLAISIIENLWRTNCTETLTGTRKLTHTLTIHLLLYFLLLLPLI